MVVTKKSGAKRAAAVKNIAAPAEPKAKAVKATLPQETTPVVAEAVQASVQAVLSAVETTEPVVEAAVAKVAPKAEAFRDAVSEAVATSAHGVLAVNDKIIEALQVQSHAALDLWRNALSAPRSPDAFRLHASHAREAYETASAQWKEVADVTSHWFTKSVEPLSSAMADRKR